MDVRHTCFVIMPFGEKPDGEDVVDFDAVYERLIVPAVEAAGGGVECVRCDKIPGSGSIHTRMIDQIFEARVAVVDLTTLNPNVFYELGVRHALRDNVTVLIRRAGTDSPFNIAGLSIIDYDLSSDDEIERARKAITTYIEVGLRRTASDSRVFDALPGLHVARNSKRLPDGQRFSYRCTGAPSKKITLVTGDLRKIKGVDIWVNSENTDMQMARFSDRSVSSLIRVGGAKKGRSGWVTEDVIADELQALLEEEGVKSVAPGAVLPTGSGELRRTNGVKRVYHAAAVTGIPGQGYSAVPNIADCVRGALTLADEESAAGEKLTSILFQIMGAGAGGQDPHRLGAILMGEVLTYFELDPDCAIQEACFVITRERTLEIWQTVLAEFGDRVSPEPGA